MAWGELLNIGLKVLGAAIGIFVVSIIIGGIAGVALRNGAALAAIAGLLCLGLGILRRR